MSDETDTTSEVARVLNLHASFKASAEIQDPNTPWYWECDGCDTRLVLSGTYGRPEVIAALAAHQAAMLASAGLLRPAGTDHLAEDLRENTEALMAARARLADLTARIGFGDGVTEPQADNDTIVKAVNEAFTNSNTLWEVEEQVERVRALADHYEARQGTALGRVSTGNVAASIRRALGPQSPQIAAQEPAGATQGGSGGSHAPAGLGERLRSAADYQDRPGAYVELRAMADEADRLEVVSNGARIKVQLDRVVALADEWEKAAERRSDLDSDLFDPTAADAYRSRAADLRDVLAQEVP